MGLTAGQNSSESYQVTINMMGMERGRMRKELNNQSFWKAMAKIASKTAAAASTFRRGNQDPYNRHSDPAHHVSCFVQDLLKA